MQTAPASAAAMPTASQAAPGDSSSAAMPPMPTTPAATARPGGRRPSTDHAKPITSSGWIAPTTAASPPGRR
jgi:hypothetical protein